MPDDMTPYERAARVTYLLTGVGMALTTLEVAEVAGLSRDGARRLLNSISRVAPIYSDDDFVWRMCAQREAHD